MRFLLRFNMYLFLAQQVYLFLAYAQRENLKRAQPVFWASFWLFGQSEGVNLAISSSLSFFSFVFSFSLQNAPFEQALISRSFQSEVSTTHGRTHS